MRVSIGDSRLNVTIGSKASKSSAQIPTDMSKTSFQDLQNRVAALETAVTGDSDDIAALASRMTAAESGISTNTLNIGSLSTQVSSLTGRMTATEGNVSGLLTDMNTAQGDINDLKSDLNTAEGNISDLQGRMTTAEGSLTSLSDTVSSQGTAITGILSRLGTAEDSITSLLTRMTAAEVQTAKVPTIETQLAGVVADLTAAQTNIANIKKRIEMSVGSEKNLLTCGADGYFDGLTHEHKGITYTVNSDGSVTANGEASGASYFYFTKTLQLEYGKSYWISGCPSGGATNKYRIRCDAVSNTSTYVQDTGAGKSLTPASAEQSLRRLMIIISSGTRVENLKFYPMVVEGDEGIGYISPATAKDEDARMDIESLFGAVEDITKTISVLSTIQSDIETLKDGVVTGIDNGIIEIGDEDDDT